MSSPSEKNGHSGSGHEFIPSLLALGKVLGVLGTVAGAAFTAGLYKAEAGAKVPLAEVMGASAQCQASLKIAEARSSDLTERLTESKAAHEGTLAELERLRVEREGMLARMQKLDSCAFFQEQIVSLQTEIDRPFVTRMIGNGGEQPTEDALEKAALEMRLADYLQKMAACQS